MDDTNQENYGPSHYDFDFDVDLRLNTIDYFLIVPYVLVIFPLAWMSELVMSRLRGFRASKNVEMNEAVFQPDFHSEAPLGTYCQWPRHSHA